MQKVLIAAFGLLPFSGCGGERQTTDDTAEPDSDVPVEECLDDDACGSFEICDDGTCRIGDRDDTLAEARPIFQVSGPDDPNVASGLIHAPGDVDHWAYTATGPEWLRIWTQTDENAPDGLDTVLSVYAPNGSLHHVMDEFGTGSVRSYDSLMNVYLPSAGVWTLKVEDKGTYYADEVERGSETFRYDLGVEAWGSTTDEPDGIDDPDVTFNLANGSTIYPWGVVIDEAGDVDWTTAAMPYGDAPFEVWAPDAIPGSPLRPRIEVTDADGTLVMAKDDVGETGFASFFDGYQTTWTVAVTDVEGGGGPDHWTVLYLRTRTEGSGNPREVEPNDTADNATLLDQERRTEGGTTTDRAFLQGRLNTEGDVDAWAFDAVEGGTLRLACSSDRYGSLGDVDVEVLAPDGTSLGVFSDGDDRAPDIDSLDGLTAGGHTLVFSEKNGETGPAVYYRCGVYVDHP